MLDDHTKMLLAIEQYMPDQSTKALEHFVVTNPQMNGAKWADALDIMIEADAHCALTDAIYDDLKHVVPLGTASWIAPIFLTLMYSRKGHVPYAAEVAYWHGLVTGLAEKSS